MLNDNNLRLNVIIWVNNGFQHDKYVLPLEVLQNCIQDSVCMPPTRCLYDTHLF